MWCDTKYCDIQCHENIKSYHFEAYGLSECDAMYTDDQHIHYCTYLKSPEVHCVHSVQYNMLHTIKNQLFAQAKYTNIWNMMA
jgi:hypothetical protein